MRRRARSTARLRSGVSTIPSAPIAPSSALLAEEHIGRVLATQRRSWQPGCWLHPVADADHRHLRARDSAALRRAAARPGRRAAHSFRHSRPGRCSRSPAGLGPTLGSPEKGRRSDRRPTGARDPRPASAPSSISGSRIAGSRAQFGRPPIDRRLIAARAAAAKPFSSISKYPVKSPSGWP